MKILGWVMVGLLVGASTVSADISYDAKGRIVQTGVYDGPSLGQDDLLGASGLLQVIGGLALSAHPALIGAGEATFLYWGAQRTAKYRPQEVKDQIHASLATQVKDPVKPWWMVKPSH